MIPEQNKPQDEGGWTKIDEGWRKGLKRTLVGRSGVIRKQTMFFDNRERIQQDILPGDNLVRTVSTETASILGGALNRNLEDISSASFVNMSEAHIRVYDYETKTSLTMFESPDTSGEIIKRIGITKGIADETAFYFGRYAALEGSTSYRGGYIEFIKIASKIDNPMSMQPIAPGIKVSFGDNDQNSFMAEDAGGFLTRDKLEFFPDSEDKRVSTVFRPPFGRLDRQNLEFQVQDTGDKFILEMMDTTTKRTIRVSAAKKVDFDSLYSIVSTPDFTGWEKALEHVDEYFSVGKDLQ